MSTDLFARMRAFITDVCGAARKAVAAGAAALSVTALGGVELASIDAAQYEMTSAWEGTVYTVYADSGGVLTSCIGHTGPELQPGQTFTRAQCEDIFRRDMREKVDLPLSRCLKPPAPLGPETVVALRDFTFNVGGDAACGSTVMRLINEGRTREACEQFSRWVFVKRVFVRGLENRRIRDMGGRISERTMCLRGLK